MHTMLLFVPFPIPMLNFGPGNCTLARKRCPMICRLLLLPALVSVALGASSQTPGGLDQLAGSTGQKWSVVGTSSAADAACTAGEGYYTFQMKPAQVVTATCVGGKWQSRTEAITAWAANGKSGIAFGGAQYEVKALSASAPVCKGNANCLRLASVPDGKTDATRTIYLTR